MEQTARSATTSPFAATFTVSPAAPNILRVPRVVREYVNENGEGRSFNLESFDIHHEVEPGQFVVELSIVNKGAELLEPFAVSIVLWDPAAQQFAAAFSKLLATSLDASDQGDRQ
jgi:hypothetical protein